jgi:hypothetical protein
VIKVVAAGLQACLIALVTTARVAAQFGPPPPEPPGTAKQKQRLDITGWWVSVIHEDWRFRMVTPPKGDTVNIPLNPAGKKIADSWDVAKDEAAADKCKAYGAPNLMRVPSRFHITWQDDATLKIESDAGRQTRLLRFEAPKMPPPPSRQGLSIARWQGRASLAVETSRLLPGYLQTNGVPYSANATMLENFDVVKQASGEEWLIIDTIVTDPTYLFRTFVRSTHFKKEADGSKWDPQPCIVRW